MEVQSFTELMQKLVRLEANVAILNGASTNTNEEIEGLRARRDDLARGNGYDSGIISEDFSADQGAA